MARILFIDPGSISTGWALFEGTGYVASGTIAADAKADAFTRLESLYSQYMQLAWKEEMKTRAGGLHEVHIERLVRNTHIYTHYAVAIIGVALRQYSPVFPDVAIRSWQKAVEWPKLTSAEKSRPKHAVLQLLRDRLPASSPLYGFAEDATSDDELAAIGMGIYWTRFRKE